MFFLSISLSLLNSFRRRWWWCRLRNRPAATRWSVCDLHRGIIYIYISMLYKNIQFRGVWGIYTYNSPPPAQCVFENLSNVLTDINVRPPNTKSIYAKKREAKFAENNSRTHTHTHAHLRVARDRVPILLRRHVPFERGEGGDGVCVCSLSKFLKYIRNNGEMRRDWWKNVFKIF